MKKLTFACLIFVLASFLNAGGFPSQQKKSTQSYKNPAQATAARNSAKSYLSQQASAEKSKDPTLAMIYKKCADAQLKTAKGYDIGDKNLIDTGNSELKQALVEVEEATHGQLMYQAKQLESKGNKPMAEVLKKMALARLNKGKAMKTGDKRALDAANLAYNKALGEREKIYADDLIKQADKASDSGKIELAAALRKCAAAKLKIAQGYTNNDNNTKSAGYLDYKQAIFEREKAIQGEELVKADALEEKGDKAMADVMRKMANAKIKMAEASKNSDKTSSAEAKAEYNNALAERENLYANDLRKQAEEAQNTDKPELADALNKCADAKLELGKAYQANDATTIAKAAMKYKKFSDEKNKAMRAKKTNKKK